MTVRREISTSTIRTSLDLIDKLEEGTPGDSDWVAYFDIAVGFAKKSLKSDIGGGGGGGTNQNVNSDTAITTKNGSVVITKGSAAAITLALPTVTTDDYKFLKIVDTTGFAHVITTPAGGINGSFTTVTFPGIIGVSINLLAFNGSWYTIT